MWVPIATLGWRFYAHWPQKKISEFGLSEPNRRVVPAYYYSLNTLKKVMGAKIFRNDLKIARNRPEKR